MVVGEPVRTDADRFLCYRRLSDVVDRAMLAAWACQPYDGKLIPDDVNPLHH